MTNTNTDYSTHSGTSITPNPNPAARLHTDVVTLYYDERTIS